MKIKFISAAGGQNWLMSDFSLPELWSPRYKMLGVQCVYFYKSAGSEPRPLMSGLWNSSAVSSAAWCRLKLQWFCPVFEPGTALAPSLASLACYNQAGMLRM